MKPGYNPKFLYDQLLQLIETEYPPADSTFKQRLEELITGFVQPDTPQQCHEVSILLSDIRGFTSISERYEAAQILHMLNHYFSRMNRIIQKYDGMIDKYMGDAIMVVFGINTPSAEDPSNAVACAIEMQMAMDEVNNYNRTNGFPEIFAGIGINTGKVSSGQLGSDIHNEFSIIGDGVNLASRIESHSLRGQILISSNTYKQVKENVITCFENSVQVKGKAEPVTLYAVSGLHYKNRYLETPVREDRHSVRLEMNQEFSFNIIRNKQVMTDEIQGIIRDISYNGLFVFIEKDIDVMTDIRFALALNLIGGQTRNIYGKIVSRRQMANGYGYGIEFTSLDDISQQSIKNFIDRIISGS